MAELKNVQGKMHTAVIGIIKENTRRVKLSGRTDESMSMLRMSMNVILNGKKCRNLWDSFKKSSLKEWECEND